MVIRRPQKTSRNVAQLRRSSASTTWLPSSRSLGNLACQSPFTQPFKLGLFSYRRWLHQNGSELLPHQKTENRLFLQSASTKTPSISRPRNLEPLMRGQLLPQQLTSLEITQRHPVGHLCIHTIARETLESLSKRLKAGSVIYRNRSQGGGQKDPFLIRNSTDLQHPQ